MSDGTGGMRARQAGIGRHPAVTELVRWFDVPHLSVELRGVADPFGALAAELLERVEDSPELTDCLRHLLRAKDSAVRATILTMEQHGRLLSDRPQP